MKNNTKNKLLYFLLSLTMGALAAAVIWIFFQLMNNGITLLWTTLGAQIKTPFYPLILGIAGGLLIGLFRRQFGDYPETMDVVMGKIKHSGSYPYHNLHILFVAALLPILFGASIGPEAGLTGVIVGICYFIGDRLKYAGAELKEFTQIGMAATLGVIFNAPMFGFMMPLEPNADEDTAFTFPKSSNIAIYFTAILGGLLAFGFLNRLFPGESGGMPRFSKASVGIREDLLALPIAVISGCIGILFFGAETYFGRLFAPLKKHPVISSMIGGLVIGLTGVFAPLLLYSGEHQLSTLMDGYQTIGFGLLLATGILKLLLTPFCIASGFKGGHIFPVIFGGAAIGYAFACILPVDPVFSVTIATASVTGAIKIGRAHV